jgi:hypothetical protein
MQGVSGSNPLGSTQYFPVFDWVFYCLFLALSGSEVLQLAVTKTMASIEEELEFRRSNHQVSLMQWTLH